VGDGPVLGDEVQGGLQDRPAHGLAARAALGPGPVVVAEHGFHASILSYASLSTGCAAGSGSASAWSRPRPRPGKNAAVTRSPTAATLMEAKAVVWRASVSGVLAAAVLGAAASGGICPVSRAPEVDGRSGRAASGSCGAVSARPER